MTEHSEYVPGVCNIGDTEAANRRAIGIGGLVVTVLIAAGLLAIDAPAAAMLVLFLPGFVMATGFIQARTHFCAGYGMQGMSNFSDERGRATTTEAPDQLAADRTRAKRITLHSALLGLLVALAGVAVASLV
jgi:hypothetical protein